MVPLFTPPPGRNAISERCFYFYLCGRTEPRLCVHRGGDKSIVVQHQSDIIFRFPGPTPIKRTVVRLGRGPLRFDSIRLPCGKDTQEAAEKSIKMDRQCYRRHMARGLWAVTPYNIPAPPRPEPPAGHHKRTESKHCILGSHAF